MRTRRRLLQKWRYAIDVCLVGVRKTSREVLARFVVGMLLGGDVLLVHVAQALPHHVRTASVERRLRRCLANQRVVGERWWPPLVQPQLPARRVAAWLIECEVTLVADQGFTGPDLIHLCQESGWRWVLRVSADSTHGLKLTDGCRPWGLVETAASECIRRRGYSGGQTGSS